jgi:transducin (beta)-like 1
MTSRIQSPDHQPFLFVVALFSCATCLCISILYYRYLQECGFVHAAYTFSHESMLLGSGNGGPMAASANSTTAGPFQKPAWHRAADKSLPPGALISFLQKGLQYVGIEEALLQQQQESKKNKNKETSNNDPSMPVDFSLLSPSTIQTLSRKTPPIQLTVPPAAAAAAVKARLEAQAAAATEQSNDQAAIARNAIAVSQHQQQNLIQTIPDKTVAVGGANSSRQPDAFGGGTKRNASGTKRSAKKQKTAKPWDPSAAPEASSSSSGKANPTFSSLEQAMAQLEASKQNKHGESDIGISQTNSESQPYPSQEPQPGLVNGQRPHGGLNGGGSSDKGDNDSKLSRDSSMEEGETRDDPDDDVTNAADDPYVARPDEILKLDKHVSEVFMCAWNPVYTNLIATGSGDASARIWEMNDKYAKAGLKGCIELPHGIESGDKKNKDVTTLEWSTDGLLLATGSYDGIARVWDRKGSLIHTLRGHQGPIFSLKWNREGNFLLSGSYDKTIIVWNVSGITADGGSANKGFIEHQFKDHEAPALDVDWKDNITFASCSTDRTVHIYRVDTNTPLKIYRGHADEVNAVKWSPSGKYLASCSDDCTAKVWEVDSERSDPLYDFVNHDQEIYTVKWSPTGPGSANPTKMPLLATASFDGSIRLWNIQDGSCFGFFNQHRDSVYSVAFSPSGDFLASGSLAGQLYIWDVAEQRYIKSYKGKGDIFEVAWNKEETRVAACFSSNVVAVIDFDRNKYPKTSTTIVAAAGEAGGASGPSLPLLNNPERMVYTVKNSS